MSWEINRVTLDAFNDALTRIEKLEQDVTIATDIILDLDNIVRASYILRVGDISNTLLKPSVAGFTTYTPDAQGEIVISELDITRDVTAGDFLKFEYQGKVRYLNNADFGDELFVRITHNDTGTVEDGIVISEMIVGKAVGKNASVTSFEPHAVSASGSITASLVIKCDTTANRLLENGRCGMVMYRYTIPSIPVPTA